MTPDRRRAPQPEPLAAAGGADGMAAAGGTEDMAAAGGAEEVAAAALHARRAGEVVGVLVLRLDRAGLLADAYGQELVDDLLAGVGSRLRRTIRVDDRLLPAGRDGLCLVARSMPGQRDVALLAERVVRAAARPLALPDGVEHEVTVSVGASVGRDGDGPAALLARAERRCREVAAAGGGRWSVEPVDTNPAAGTHDRAVRDDAVARLRQAGELRQALAANQLDLALTPLTPLTVDLFTPTAAGDAPDQELLASRQLLTSAVAGGPVGDKFRAGTGAGEWRVVAVRWRHPVRGLLHPTAVVAAVVDAGLAGAYLESGLRLAASAAVDASVAAGQPVGVALDLPLAVAAQARAQGADLAALVAGAVARARLDPSQLALRITADDARAGAPVLAPALEQLAGLGVTTMLTGIDPSPGTLAWLDTWPHASIWLLDRAVAASLALPLRDARPGPTPAAPELAPAVILARTATAAAVAAARARQILCGAEGVDDPVVAAELATAGVALAEGRWATRPRSTAMVG